MPRRPWRTPTRSSLARPRAGWSRSSPISATAGCSPATISSMPGRISPWWERPAAISSSGGSTTIKGVQMVDLVHASRGCRFNCYPCAVAYLGGREFRPRPVDRAIAEMAGNRQQPPVYRRQLPGPGHRLGDRAVPGDDPAEEEMVLPSHRGQARGPRSGGPGRRLVCLSGGIRHLRLYPGADQALP